MLGLYQVFVDGSSIFTDAETPEEAIRALTYCITFGQAAARVKSRSIASSEYFTEFTIQLDRLGWRHSNVGRNNLSQTLSNSTLAAALIPVVQPVIADLEKIFTVWKSREEPGALTFWWDHVNAGQTLNLGFGSFEIKDEIPTLRFLAMSIRRPADWQDSDGWRCLFMQQSRLQLSLSYRNVTLIGDPDIYTPLLPQLEARIGDRIADHVRLERISYDGPTPSIVSVALLERG